MITCIARVSALAVCVYCGSLAASVSADGPQPVGGDAAPKGEDGPKPFAPGVRIDWQNRLVEVDAKIVLREGTLELLACSPQTREHESILSVPAKPTHIFQALGLIGLEPGAPVRYDDKEDRLFPPTGTPLEISVRYRVHGKEMTVPARRWLLDVERKRPPESIDWVFAGSQMLEDKSLAADLDGTIICVVDFETALIAVGTLHTANNRYLWLAANTDAIPPISTPCTLMIRRARGNTIEVHINMDGTLYAHDRSIAVEELTKLAVHENTKRPVLIRLSWDPKLTDDRIESAVQALVRAGIDRSSIEMNRPEPDP